MKLEPVHTVNGYYDGPEVGVADFRGQPHVYRRVSERHDGEPEDYRLSPIDPEALKAVLDDWKLYLKWEACADVDKGGVSDSPRVLSADVARYLELRPRVEAALRVDEANAVRAKGTFVDRMTKVRWFSD
jgi:hypothetical protein